MKKKAFSILVLLLTTLGTASAQTFNNVSTETALNTLIDGEKNVRLTADIVLTKPVYVDEVEVTLDLNGHTLNRNLQEPADEDDGHDQGHVIEMNHGAKLTIIDSSGKNSGKITGGYSNSGGGIWVNGTLTLKGGTITGNKASDEGGGICIRKGSQLIMEGGVISGNTADEGGGIYIRENATATISGGSIIGNLTATSASYGGGIYIEKGTLNMQGNPVVQGNLPDNVWVQDKQKVMVTGSFISGAHIGVKLESGDGVFTSGFSENNVDKAPGDVFFGYNNSEVYTSDGECALRSTEITGSVSYCMYHWDGTKAVRRTYSTSGFRVLKTGDDLSNLGNGRYVVNGRVVIDKRIYFNDDADLILMDGCELVAKKGIGINEKADLRILTQEEGSGRLTAHSKQYTAIGGDEDKQAGNLEIHGGIIDAEACKANHAAIGSGKKGGMKSITIYAGMINAEADDDAAAIGKGEKYSGPETVVRIYGGTINAQGGWGGAGIGGGRGHGHNGPVYIYGGNIMAKGGRFGSGIGGGSGGHQSQPIYISGGIVTAMAGEAAAGIGGGPTVGKRLGIAWKVNGGGDGGDVTINGGMVTAVGNGGFHWFDWGRVVVGAGIGGSAKGKGGYVTVNNGVVIAGGIIAIGGGTSSKNPLSMHTRRNVDIKLAKGLKVLSDDSSVPNPKNLMPRLRDDRYHVLNHDMLAAIMPCAHEDGQIEPYSENPALGHKVYSCAYCEYEGTVQPHVCPPEGGPCELCSYVLPPVTPPYALYCEGNKTLYFVNTTDYLRAGSEWDGQKVTMSWCGDEVTKTGGNYPGWTKENFSKEIERVVFDSSFGTVRPTSCHRWFSYFTSLKTIEGMSNLNTSDVTNMEGMFNHCESLTSINVNSFDMSNVTTTVDMFRYCTSLETIVCDQQWTVNKTTDMFRECTKLKGQVTYEAYHWHGDMANSETGYFTKPYFALYLGEAKALCFTYAKEDLQVGGEWQGETISNVWFGDDVENSGDMPAWYDTAKDAESVIIDPSFIDARPKSLSRWFSGDKSLKIIDGLENLNTSEVTTMHYMFANCELLDTLDVNTFDVSKVSDAAGMFFECKGLKTILSDKIWYIENTNKMFYNCESLEGAIPWSADLTGWEGDGQYANPATGFFTGELQLKAYVAWCADNKTLYFASAYDEVEPGELWNGINLTGVWRDDDVLDSGEEPAWLNMAKTAERVVFEKSFNNALPQSLSYWFANFTNLTTIEGLEYLNTSEVANADHMFQNCKGITTLEATSFRFPFLTDASELFAGCSNLQTVYSNLPWSTSDGTDMFKGCEKLSGVVDYDSQKTDALMASPINGYFTKHFKALWCKDSKTLYFVAEDRADDETTEWNGEPITKVYTEKDAYKEVANNTPFYLAIGATRIVFDESFAQCKPLNCSYWFYNFKNLTDIEGIENLKTSKVTDMSHMFEYCQILPFIDVDGFDVSRVTNAECMFSSCFKLETIICDNTWSIDGNTHWMFYDSEMLKGATAYNSEKTDCAMANPTVGYFSPTPNIELKDGEDNSTLLAKYKGKRVNVTYDRVLSAVELDYDFYEPCAYTVCLPYDLDLSEQHNADLLQVCQLNYIQGGKYMIFSNADPVLKAGTPYLILMNEGEQRLDAKGVIITDEVAEGVPVLAYGEEYQELGTWKGTLHRIEGAAAAEMFAYSLQNDGYFKRIRPNTPQITCPAFRAYYSANEFTGREVYMPKFKLTIAGEDEDDDPILELPAAAFSPDSSIPDEAVGIIQVVTKNGDNEFFDLQGRKLQNRPVRKGLYIENGKKVMVK